MAETEDVVADDVSADEGADSGDGLTPEMLSDTPGRDQDTKGDDEPAKPAAKDGEQPKTDEAEQSFADLWDPKRQEKDQEAANLRKSVDRLSEMLEKQSAELAALRRGEKPPQTLDEAIEALNTLEEPDPDIAPEEEVAKYRRNLKRLTGKVAELREQERQARKAEKDKPAAKPDEPPAKKPAAEAPKGLTPDDFKAVLKDADAKYGAKFRAKAAAQIVVDLRNDGYGPGKVPSASELRVRVMAAYADLALAAASRGEKPGKGSDKPAAESDDDLDLGGTGPGLNKRDVKTTALRPKTTQEHLDELRRLRKSGVKV